VPEKKPIDDVCDKEDIMHGNTKEAATKAPFDENGFTFPSTLASYASYNC
jgi:hypothetical protein